MSSINDLYGKFLGIRAAIQNKGGIVTVANTNPTPDELIAGIGTIMGLNTVSSMPTASASTVGAMYKYIGATDDDFENGKYYMTLQSNNTYSWILVNERDIPTSGNAMLIAYVIKSDGTPLINKSVVITNTATNDAETVMTDRFGKIFKEVVAGTYSIAISDAVDGYITPTALSITVVANQMDYSYLIYVPSTVTYGVKIDLANSNPESSVTYTDDAVGFDKSYMDFENDTFVPGSWADKFPFNEVKPCYMVNGEVTKYLNPNNFAEDLEGNPVDITSNGLGDVMIEIPKIYYKIYKDASYQYIKISDTAQEGFSCLAHTYKGVEKNKIYIGAYQSYNGNSLSRSVSGVSATGSVSLNTWRTYAQSKGAGYENVYWNLIVLLQSLFVIQFKNLDSQSALGYGLANDVNYSTGGGLNTKGMYYGTATNGQVKFMGIEDFYGSRYQWIDGAYINGTSLTVADATDENMAFNGAGTGYKTVKTGLATGGGYFTSIVGENNESGFTPQNFSGSASTYYCDYGCVGSGCVPYFGGSRSYATSAGAFCLFFSDSAGNSNAYRCGRLAFCG